MVQLRQNVDLLLKLELLVLLERVSTLCHLRVLPLDDFDSHSLASLLVDCTLHNGKGTPETSRIGGGLPANLILQLVIVSDPFSLVKY